MKATEDGQALRPVGRVNSELRMVQGDIHMKRNDPAQAAGAYVVVVELLDDNDEVLKPLALWKLIKALEAKDDKAGAAEYSRQLEAKYPGWKPPAP
jgi:Tfp pilus assembly protein PilF